MSQIVDRRGRLAALAGGETAGLELGCGPTRSRPDFITVDLANHDSVDVVGDALLVLQEIPDDSVEGVYSQHFAEHVDDLGGILREIIRVCRDGAKVTFITPHFSNSHFYSDVTHRNFFGLYTFCYLSKSKVKFGRTLPDYAQIPGLVLEDVRLVFKSFRPYYVRHGFRKAVQALVNSSRYMQELYEEAFTGLVSCYEVRYDMVVNKE